MIILINILNLDQLDQYIDQDLDQVDQYIDQVDQYIDQDLDQVDQYIYQDRSTLGKCYPFEVMLNRKLRFYSICPHDF